MEPYQQFIINWKRHCVAPLFLFGRGVTLTPPPPPQLRSAWLFGGDRQLIARWMGLASENYHLGDNLRKERGGGLVLETSSPLLLPFFRHRVINNYSSRVDPKVHADCRNLHLVNDFAVWNWGNAEGEAKGTRLSPYPNPMYVIEILENSILLF